MFEHFTAGALRALGRAEARAEQRGSEQVEVLDLIAAILDEPENKAAALLDEHGLDPSRLRALLELAELIREEAEQKPRPHAARLRTVMQDAVTIAKTFDRTRSVGTEHLLSAILDAEEKLAQSLAAAGADLDRVRAALQEEDRGNIAPIPIAQEIGPLELSDPDENFQLARILDASANRAKEGLRVVEDYVRFALDDPFLTRRIKEARHRLGETVKAMDAELLIGSRDTRGDIGTHIMTASERTRENPRAVLAANFKRTQEALRTLEEFGKLLDTWIAGRFEVLRYDVYTLEKLVSAAAAGKKAIGDARLMFLVGGLPTMGDLTWIVGEALAGGADVIQLREKKLDDRELLSRAREVRILTAKAGAKFVMNDRPDLARLAGADGVHLGQTDVTVRDARRIVGASAQIGVSTHDGTQIDKAILDAANYLGVGPVFTSGTKDFDELAGLGHVRRAAETTSLPWFAIGGIDLENLDEVLEAGATRIAVGGAITRAEYPRRATAALKSRLEGISVD